MERDALFAWMLIGGMAVSAFVIRALFVLPGSRLRLPPAVERVLRFAPAAALMAIIVPNIAASDGAVVLTPENPRFIAGIVAFVVAARTRSIILTILAGMLALTLTRLAAG